MTAFLGIGDLHFDGPLIRFIPDLNDRICAEVESVFRYAREEGVRNVFFYGDIFHKPVPSAEGQRAFLRLLMGASDLRLFVIAGNHDKEATHGTLAEHPSLSMFETMQEFALLPHVRFVVHDPVTIKLGGERVRFLPWPHSSVDPNAVNVIHVEAHGSALDNGRVLENRNDSTHRLLDTDAQCVAGHLHTSQKIRDTHYSGTLYQTTFGESLPKFFHHCTITDGELSVEKVPHAPQFRLHNIVVKSEKDLSLIPTPNDGTPQSSNRITDFCKLFIHKDVVMPVDLLEQHPNVIRHNTFKTAKELEVLVREELRLDGVDIDLDEATWVKGWLKKAEADVATKRRAMSIYSSMRGPSALSIP